MYGHEVGLLVLFEPFNPGHSAWDRFAIMFRLMIFRVGFRFGELCRLGISNFPIYARSRWDGLKRTLAEVLWRNSARFHDLKRRSGSLDSEEIMFLAASSYKPKPLGCPTVIFRSKDCPIYSAGDPYFGLRKMFTGHSETHEVPGDHTEMLREPNVQVLAEQLRACLQNARQAGTTSNHLSVDWDRSRS